MKVWEPFRKSRTVRIVCFAVAGALLVASAIGLWYSPSASGGTQTPGASYEHNGRFNYTVYLNPNTLYGSSIQPEDEEETTKDQPLVFFRDIIEEARLAFSYRFDCSEPVANVTNNVVVTITAENPGMWQKEMPVLEETYTGREFRVDFPLYLESLERIVEDIEEEIGFKGSQRKFIIKATVHTEARTSSGRTIKDNFSHEITALLREHTLELEGNLKSSDTGAKEGVSYNEEGWFDYEIYLKDNRLYGATVLRSEGFSPVSPPSSSPSPPQTLGPGLIYFPKIIDNIRASFSYQFSYDRPVSVQSEEVEITAVIEKPDTWSKSIVLVPKTKKVGDFSISFPVDINHFTDIISAVQKETGAGGGSYNLRIKADVHTIAQTAIGTVNERYRQSLEGELDGNTLTFGEQLSQSQSGSVGGDTIPAGSEQGGVKTPWLGGLIVALLALGYFGLSQTQLKPAIGGIEAEAARARKKYGQMIVDTQELPEVKPSDMVVPLSSLDDLVRIADDLVKPILHQAEEGRHIYCTIDGAVRYQYLSQLRD